MQTQTIPRALAAGAVIVAVALVFLLARGPTGELALSLSDSTDAPPVEVSVTTARPDAEPEPSPRQAPAAEKVRELEAMSETFRNTTFLIAIRDAGFVCNELLQVFGGIDDSGKWIARCSEMLSYTVGVTGDGALRIDPMLQYFDGVLQRINLQQNPAPIQIPTDRPLRDGLPPEAR